MGLDVSGVAASIIAKRGLLKDGMMHLPYVSLVNGTTVRLRDNSFMSCIRVEGLNALTTPDRELDVLKHAFAAVLAQMGPEFTIYVHRVSRRIDLSSQLAPLGHNGFAQAVDQRWREGMKKGVLRDRRLTISVIKTGRLNARLGAFSSLKNMFPTESETRDLERLQEVCRFLRASLGNEQTRILKAETGDLLGFLSSIQTGNEQPVFPSPGLSVLSDDVLSDRVTFNGDFFELEDGPDGARFGALRAIKTYAQASWVTIFDEFALPCDYVISQSFRPMGNNDAASLIERKRRTMRATSDVRAQAEEQLAALHEKALTQEVSLGEHHFTVALIDDDRARVKELTSELEGIAATSGVRLVKDRLVARAHYFAQFPGNSAARCRVNPITNINFADFASLHRTPLGKGPEELPWETPIAVFPTVDGSSYQFSFHRSGSPQGEPPAGHTVMLGDTGSGKSVLAGFLMAQARRADARIFVFDYRKGLEMTTRALGGSYTTIESGRRTGLNPLSVETDDDGVTWLTDWLSRILSPDKPLSALQTRTILDHVKRNATAGDDLRNWDDFAGLFNAADDDGDLLSLVSEWAPGGRFGWVFGESGKDSFSLKGDVVGFDLTQILDAQSDRERMAVLSYIFRRIEREIRDKRRTIVLIDEAHRALDNSYFAAVIESWLATLRKQNAAVVMLTQNPAQIVKSKVGSQVFSFFSTQIVFPNPKADPEDFDALRLNEKELGIVTSRLGGRAFLLRDDRNSVVLNGDASSLGGLLRVIEGGKGDEAMQSDGVDEFWRKFL